MPTPQQKKAVDQNIEFFKKMFFMEHWNIQIIYSKKPDPSDEDGGGDTLASLACTSHEYFTTQMTLYPAFFKKDKETQKSSICHELLHIITNIQDNLLWLVISKEKLVTWREKNEAREKATSWIERILSKLLKFHEKPHGRN